MDNDNMYSGKNEGSDSGYQPYGGNDSVYYQGGGSDSGYQQNVGTDAGYQQNSGTDASYQQYSGSDAGYQQYSGTDTGYQQYNGNNSDGNFSQYQYNNNSYQSPYYVQPPQPDMEEPISLGEWIIIHLIMLVPCVNLVMMFVWAFSSSEKKSKSNYFKAKLIMAGIVFAIYIVFFIFILFLEAL